MKLPLFVLQTLVLILTTSGQPQAPQATTVNLPPHLMCFPIDDAHPQITYDDCAPAMDDMTKEDGYWLQQRWDGYPSPRVLAFTRTCRIFLNYTIRSKDLFSWADIQARAFYALARCSNDQLQSAGGTITVGDKQEYTVSIRGVRIGDLQSNGTIVDSAATS